MRTSSYFYCTVFIFYPFSTRSFIYEC